MLKIIRVVTICLFILSLPTANAVTTNDIPSYVPPPVRITSEYGKVFTREEISAIVVISSKKYNVSYEKMMYTIEAESHFANVQSSCHKSEYSLCDRIGIREKSYGVAQFHVSTFPKEKALDIYQAIEEMAYYFSINEACRWTEYRKKYGCLD